MLTTATHDTKRGEDARIRIALLSEMPREWGRRSPTGCGSTARAAVEVDGEIVPDRNVEYLFYQIAVWRVAARARRRTIPPGSKASPNGSMPT